MKTKRQTVASLDCPKSTLNIKNPVSSANRCVYTSVTMTGRAVIKHYPASAFLHATGISAIKMTTWVRVWSGFEHFSVTLSHEQ